jgi:hypothetical protein
VKRVYASGSLWEAGEILALLEQQRIPAMLLNENVAGMPGLLPLNPQMTADAEVWVLDDELAGRCARLIAEFQAAGSAPSSGREATWQCASCGEDNPAGFDLCWSCGTPA